MRDVNKGEQIYISLTLCHHLIREGCFFGIFAQVRTSALILYIGEIWVFFFLFFFLIHDSSPYRFGSSLSHKFIIMHISPTKWPMAQLRREFPILIYVIGVCIQWPFPPPPSLTILLSISRTPIIFSR